VVTAVTTGGVEVSGPEQVVRDPGRLRDGAERALAGGATWLWLLDGSAEERAEALGALLDDAERAEPIGPADVLTGVVLDGRVRIHPHRPPWYRADQVDIAVRAAAERLLPVRATAGPVLVSRAAAEREPPPVAAELSPAGILEWTARILRSGTGYLVADSVSDASGDLDDPMARPRTAARLLFGDAFVRADRIRTAYRVLERMTGLVNEPAPAGPPGSRPPSS